MVTKTGRELRQFPRVEKAVRVRFQLTETPPSAPQFGYIEAVTRNISEGGVFLEIKEHPKLRDDAVGNFILYKSRLKMEISLAGSDVPLGVKGKAVWIERKVPGKETEYHRGVAIQFLEVDPNVTATIRSFVSRVLADG